MFCVNFYVAKDMVTFSVESIRRDWASTFGNAMHHMMKGTKAMTCLFIPEYTQIQSCRPTAE